MTWKQAQNKNAFSSILNPEHWHNEIDENPVIYLESILLPYGLPGWSRGAKMATKVSQNSKMESQNVKKEAPTPPNGNPEHPKGIQNRVKSCIVPYRRWKKGKTECSSGGKMYSQVLTRKTLFANWRCIPQRWNLYLGTDKNWWSFCPSSDRMVS